MFRYDFNVYPPGQIDIGEVEPNYDRYGLDRFGGDVYFAPSGPEPWLASGEFVNIEDFWFACDPPDPELLKIPGYRFGSYLSSGTKAFRAIYQYMAFDERARRSLSEIVFGAYGYLSSPPNREAERKIMVGLAAVQELATDLVAKRVKLSGINDRLPTLICRAVWDIDEQPTFDPEHVDEPEQFDDSL